MSQNNAKHYTKELARWISEFTLDSVPADVQERARHIVLDGLGCGLVGAHLPWSAKAAQALFAAEPDAGTASIIGWNRGLSPMSAALLNSSFIQGFELDDWHSEAPLHSNSLLIPTLFAAAEYLYKSEGRNVTGKEFLQAMLVGYEVGPRVGNALWGTHILSTGWHSGAVFGPAACAAAAGNLLRLNPTQIEDALGTACTQACGLMSAQFGSDAKRMQHGFAARNGLLAVLLARQGYSGIKDVFEQEYGGFLVQFSAGNGKSPACLPSELVKELDSKWQTLNVCLKPYSSMAATHPTVDCIRNIQAEHAELKGRDAAKVISKIKITLGEAAYSHGGFSISQPIETTGAQMSCCFVAATQIIHDSVLPQQFRTDALTDKDIWTIVDKTTCERFEDKDSPFGKTTVEIRFADGRVATNTVDAARGVNPRLENKEIIKKFNDLTGPIIDQARAEKIRNITLSLDDQENLQELIALMVKETKNPIA